MTETLKIVLPMAGFGTRLRPQTWSRPKQLLTLADNTVLGHLLAMFQTLPDPENIGADLYRRLPVGEDRSIYEGVLPGSEGAFCAPGGDEGPVPRHPPGQTPVNRWAHADGICRHARGIEPVVSGLRRSECGGLGKGRPRPPPVWRRRGRGGRLGHAADRKTHLD